MSKYQYGLTTMGYYLIVIVAIVFGDYICGLVGTSGYRDLSLTTLIITSLAFFIPAAIFYIKEKSLNHSKTNWLILIMLFMLMVCGIYGIWAGKDGYSLINGVIVYHSVPLINKIAWTISVIMMFVLFYLGIAVFSKRIISCNWLRLILFGTLLVGLAAIIYSLIIDQAEYLELFKGTEGFYPWINSFFDNKNTFGQFLFMCILAVIMIDAIKPHWWHFIYLQFFLLFVLFSTAFTAIAMSYVTALCYLIYKCAITYKGHPIRNSILLGSFIFGFVAFVSTMIILYNMEIAPIYRFGNFIKSIFDKDFGSFTTRTFVWQAAMQTLQTPLEWAFGHGYKNFNVLFREYFIASHNSTNLVVDNTYVHLLGSFGIVGLVIYIGFVGLFGYITLYCIHKKRYKIAAPALIVGASVFIYDIFETAFILDPTIVGVILFFIFVMPTLVEYNNVKPQKNQTIYSLTYGQLFAYIEKWSDKRMIYFVSQVLLIPVLLLPVAIAFVSNEKLEILLSVALLICILTLLFFPYTFAMWHRRRKQRFGMLESILISSLLLVGIIVTSIILTVLFDLKVGLIVGICGYIILLVGMFIITWLTCKDSPKISNAIFKDTILPLFIPAMLFNIVFIGITVALRMTVGLTMIDGLFILVIEFSLYMFGLHRYINYKDARLENHYMIHDINTFYLNHQRDLLRKQFYKVHPNLSSDKAKLKWYEKKSKTA